MVTAVLHKWQWSRKRSTGNMYLLKIQIRIVITYTKLEELIKVLIDTKDITEKQAYWKNNALISKQRLALHTQDTFLFLMFHLCKVHNINELGAVVFCFLLLSVVIHKSLLPFYSTRKWGGENTKSFFTHFSWSYIYTHAWRKCRCEKCNGSSSCNV